MTVKRRKGNSCPVKPTSQPRVKCHSFHRVGRYIWGLFLQISAWSSKNKISGEDQLLPTTTYVPATHCHTLTDYDLTSGTTSRGSARSSWPVPEWEEIFWNLDIQSQDQGCPCPLEGRKYGSTKKVGTENSGPLDLSESTCTA
jgi:hypothetical protein